jgi:hypothetical protein
VKLKNRLIAFWNYDTYPYCLSGEVLNIKENGLVETIEYGKGYFFNPIKITSYERGLIIKNDLDLLNNEYELKLKDLKEMHKDMTGNILNFDDGFICKIKGLNKYLKSIKKPIGGKLK